MSHLGDIRTGTSWLNETTLQLKYLDSIHQLAIDILLNNCSWKVNPEDKQGTVNYLLELYQEKHEKLISDLEGIHDFIYTHLDETRVYLDGDDHTTAPIGEVSNG